MVEAVTGEALFPLQMKNKCPDFMLGDLSYIFALSFSGEKVEKIVYTVGDNGNSIGAFAFGGGTELIPCDKMI